MELPRKASPLSEGYRAIDHTADRGLRVWAGSLSGLFAQAACGLARSLTDPQCVRPRVTVALEVGGIDLEELLVGWLNEILYRFETEHLILVAFSQVQIVREGEGFRLRAQASGETWDAARHRAGAAIKAATYHGLKIVPAPDGGYDITIIFDT